MPKWRIIIPVIIVALVGIVAYMQMQRNSSEVEPTPSAPAIEEPLDVTGEEDADVQVDALVDEMLAEIDSEEAEAGNGTAEINAETAGETELEMLDVEYYAE